MNNNGIILSDDRLRIDYEKVTRMLAATYWSPGVSLSEVRKSADYSALVVGAYDPHEGQVGFMRVVSDATRFAYVADVVVDERFRKRGIGRAMVSFALAHESLRYVYKWYLMTIDAHGVYEKVGFGPLSNPDRWMMLDKGLPKWPRDM
jgi:GNAT superfamily N-acetyltransferase